MVNLAISVSVTDKNTGVPLQGVFLQVFYTSTETNPDGSHKTPSPKTTTDASGNASISASDAYPGGTCTVDVYLSGFTDWWEKKNSPNYVAHYDVVLAGPYVPPPPPTPTQGTLSVDTVPVKGTVYVKGALWGTAPQSKLVDPGTYIVTFGAVTGYQTPGSQSVAVVAGQTTQVLGTYTLPGGGPPPPGPTKGILSVDTSPPKGKVFVGGVDWGFAPQAKEVDAGNYDVTFGGINTYNTPAPQTAAVVAGQTKTVMGLYTPIATEKKKVAGDVYTDVKWDPAEGKFTATPVPGAKVTLVGPDTLTFTTDSNGCWPAKGVTTDVYKVIYALTVEASGFVTSSSTVDWSQIDFKEVELLRVPSGTGNFSGYVKDKATMVGIYAMLTISGDGVAWTTDGYYDTATLPPGSVKAGLHTVVVEASGYDTLTDSVTVAEGGNIRKDFLLTKTAAPPPAQPYKVWGKVMDIIRKRPIPGAKVTFAWKEPGTRGYNPITSVYSGSDGSYLIEKDPPDSSTKILTVYAEYTDTHGAYSDTGALSREWTHGVETGRNIDIAIWPPACSLEGLVWVDRSNDIWGGTISGKYPVPDATIRLDPLEPDLGTYSTTPDWMGRYEFGPGSTILSGKYTLSAWAPLYKQSKEEWVAPINTPVVKDIQLFLDYGSISGKITDSDTGAGVGDVAIWTNGPLKVGETNADGSYLLENVRPGTWNLWFKKGSYQDVYKSVRVETGKNTTVSFAMTYTGAPRPPPPPSTPPAGKCTIYGRVTELVSGVGLNAYVTIIEDSFIQRADVQGYYRLSDRPVPPYGYYRVQASLDGYQSKLQTVTISSGQTKEANFQLEKEPGTPPPGPPNVGSIHGTVSDTSGPVGSAGVSLQGVENVSTSSGSAGNYSLGPVQAGTYTLKVWKSGYDTFTGSVVIVAGQDVTKDVVLSKTAAPPTPPTPPTGSGTLYGYVKDSAGGPVGGASLIFSSASLASSGATTDKNGYYTITLSEGTYRLEITAPKCITVREDVAIVSDQVAGKDFTMELTNAVPTPSLPSWLGPAITTAFGLGLILLGGL